MDNPCIICGERPATQCDVCDVCYRNPETNRCDGCGSRGYIQYVFTCGWCINPPKTPWRLLGMGQDAERIREALRVAKIPVSRENRGTILYRGGDVYPDLQSWRLFVRDGRYITGSRMTSDALPEVPDHIVRFVEDRLGGVSIAERSFVDVRETDADPVVLRVGPMERAALFGADPLVLVRVMSR